MEFIVEQFWIVLIAITTINIFIAKNRAQDHISSNPQLAEGYNKIVKYSLVYGNLPWLIIGIGNILGFTKGFHSYLFPRSLNPFVLLFHASIVFIWIMSIRWVYFKNGAQFLAQHSGFISVRDLGASGEMKSPLAIKIFFGIAIGGGVAGMTMMWLMR